MTICVYISHFKARKLVIALYVCMTPTSYMYISYVIVPFLHHVGLAYAYDNINANSAPYVVTDVECPEYAYGLYDCEIEVDYVTSCPEDEFGGVICFGSKSGLLVGLMCKVAVIMLPEIIISCHN